MISSGRRILQRQQTPEDLTKLFNMFLTLSFLVHQNTKTIDEYIRNLSFRITRTKTEKFFCKDRCFVFNSVPMVTKFSTYCTKPISTLNVSKLEYLTERKQHRNTPRGISRVAILGKQLFMVDEISLELLGTVRKANKDNKKHKTFHRLCIYYTMFVFFLCFHSIKQYSFILEKQ